MSMSDTCKLAWAEEVKFPNTNQSLNLLQSVSHQMSQESFVLC